MAEAAAVVAPADRIKELEDQVEALSKEIAEQNEKLSGIEALKDDGTLEDAINGLLDLVERPTGKLTPYLPRTPETERTLLALFDVVDRRL